MKKLNFEIKEVHTLMGVGIICKNESPILPSPEIFESTKIELLNKLFDKEVIGWILQPGYYKIVLTPLSSLKNNTLLIVKEKKELSESKAFVEGGFFLNEETESVEVFLRVVESVIIEQGSIVCEGYVLKL
jgi:hypothetical protein